jgi:hypothetical protein
MKALAEIVNTDIRRAFREVTITPEYRTRTYRWISIWYCPQGKAGEIALEAWSYFDFEFTYLRGIVFSPHLYVLFSAGGEESSDLFKSDILNFVRGLPKCWKKPYIFENATVKTLTWFIIVNYSCVSELAEMSKWASRIENDYPKVSCKRDSNRLVVMCLDEFYSLINSK